MEKIQAMVSMKRTPEEKQESAEMFMPSAVNQPDYPYGLSISLCEDELEKIGFEDGDLNVDDLVHFHCMAVVTSVSSNNSQSNGPSCRVEFQITNMSAESEDEENEEAEKSMSGKQKMSKLYTS